MCITKLRRWNVYCRTRVDSAPIESSIARDRFLRSLSYYALIMLHRILVQSLHFITCRSALYSVWRTSLMSRRIHRDRSPDSLRAIGNIILLSQSSIPNPFFPSATVILGGSDWGRRRYRYRPCIRYQAAKALCRWGYEKGEEKSGGKRSPGNDVESGGRKGIIDRLGRSISDPANTH